MARRPATKASRKSSRKANTVSKPKAPTKKTNGKIDATADFTTLNAQLGALQKQQAELSTALNQVNIVIAKTQGAMEYLQQRGAKVPKPDVQEPDKKQQPAD